MAKPIFLIQLDYRTNMADMVSIKDTVEKKLTDWHVLVVRSSVSEMQFTVFSDKQADDIEIENLKQMLLNQFQ